MAMRGLGVVLALAATPACAEGVSLKGPDGQAVTLSAADIAALPHVGFSIKQHDQSHAFSGPLLATLLAKVGAPSGPALKGPELATVARVTAADGYQVVLALSDLDAGVRSERTILADREDGAPLTADGPLRLVVEGDLKPARSARNVVSIEVLRLATGKGTR
jgi:hypothetical protein